MDLKPGKYSEQKIVELFGTKKQKESYAQTGSIQPIIRKRIIEKAAKYCNVTYLKDGQYAISKVYPYVLPSQWSLMNTSLYRFITPLILKTLVDGHDEERKITFTLGRWAREIRMVNGNYAIVKSNKEEAHNQFNIPLKDIWDFYDRADDAIEYYITQVLKFLDSARAITWKEVYYVREDKIENTNTCDEQGHPIIGIRPHTRIATDEDFAFYNQCLEEADKEAGITVKKDRYYSDKSGNWLKIFHQKLYQRNITTIYKAYQAYYTHLDICQFIVDQFPAMDDYELQKNLTSEFADLLIDKADKRYKNAPLKYESRYKEFFEKMCDMVINPDTEDVSDRVPYKKKYSYSLKMLPEKKKK